MKQSTKFTLHTQNDAPAESKETLGMVEGKFGFIPNVLRQEAESPHALQGNMQLLGLLEKSSLTKEQQWIVLLVTSMECTANYCVAANATTAQMLGVSADIIQSVKQGKELADPTLEALRRFTEEMVRNRGMVSKETKEHFFEAGLTKQNILEIILGIATETFASYTARIAETPMDEQFQKSA